MGPGPSQAERMVAAATDLPNLAARLVVFCHAVPPRYSVVTRSPTSTQVTGPCIIVRLPCSLVWLSSIPGAYRP